ncbi:MAG: hypothetical protein JSR66_34150 [Proteobacteria bacterium]|nr:hypothetical protein [Pseudomonadota bacterium]
MDLAAAFVLSLLGGYCFAYRWRATALDTKRADGHHVYFRAALCGSVLFVLAMGLRKLFDWCSPACLSFDAALIEYVSPALKVESGLELVSRSRRAEWIVTAIYSLLIGIGFGIFANWVTPRNWALSRGLSTLDRLLLRSYLDGAFIALTLQSGKVYVGRVADYPNPILEPVAVAFRPMFSGSRDASGQLTLTTDYESIYSVLEAGRALVGASSCANPIRFCHQWAQTSGSPAQCSWRQGG